MCISIICTCSLLYMSNAMNPVKRRLGTGVGGLGVVNAENASNLCQNEMCFSGETRRGKRKRPSALLLGKVSIHLHPKQPPCSTAVLRPVTSYPLSQQQHGTLHLETRATPIQRSSPPATATLEMLVGILFSSVKEVFKYLHEYQVVHFLYRNHLSIPLNHHWIPM